MKRKITAKDLKKLNACPDQVHLFDRMFPDGAWITLENIRKAQAEGLDINWLLRNALSTVKYRKQDRATDRIWLNYWTDKINSSEYSLQYNQEIMRALKEDWSPRIRK